MSSIVVVLRELHGHLERVRDLRAELDAGPRRLRANQVKVEQQQKKLQEQLDAVKQAKVAIHDKEVSIKDNQAKIAKHQSQMGLVTNKKEYDALRAEIDHERQACRVLEDEILEAMMRLDEVGKATPEFEKALAYAKEELRKAEVELAGKLGDLETRLKEAEADVLRAETGLPDDAKPIYKRLAASMGAAALAPLHGRSCIGCQTEATGQQINNLRAGRMTQCKNCARLLYLVE